MLPDSIIQDFTNKLRQAETSHRRRRLSDEETRGAQRRLVNFASNDYLGLISDPPQEWTKTHGSESTSLTAHGAGALGAGASPLVTGWTRHHAKLAAALAEFKQTEAAVVWPTGFGACSGVVATLAGDEDLILSDALNHASLIDGCRLARAKTVVYPHADVAFVETYLKKHRCEFRHVWIVTDSVFSMDGEIAPLKPLCDIAETMNAAMVVDEAHATGVLGKSGRGACDLFGVSDRVGVQIGTLSKAVGCQGGFVATSSLIADVLVQYCRTFIFSTALSPVIAASAAATIRQMPNLQQRRTKVQQLTGRLRRHLELPAADAPEPMQVPIIPIIFGESEAACAAASQLRADGFLAPAIRPPTVPDGTSRIRISLSAAHTENDVDQLAQSIQKIL